MLVPRESSVRTSPFFARNAGPPVSVGAYWVTLSQPKRWGDTVWNEDTIGNPRLIAKAFCLSDLLDQFNGLDAHYKTEEIG